MKTKKESVRTRVARGAKLLDKKVPGWYRSIALKANGGGHIDVDMGSTELCILGQTFKDFFDGEYCLGLSAERSRKCGFDLLFAAPDDECDKLRRAWELEVFKRLRCDALGRQTLVALGI